jgi:hypothetical protein
MRLLVQFVSPSPRKYSPALAIRTKSLATGRIVLGLLFALALRKTTNARGGTAAPALNVR